METPTLEKAIALLNELNALDNNAISDLVSKRSFCNKQIADHPTVQCGALHGLFTVGILGILNGIFGNGNYGPIVAECKDDGKTIINFTTADKIQSIQPSKK